MTKVPVHRCVTLAKATGKLRTAKFQGKDHIVVPTVMLKEGVIWPVNADKPEFVSAQVLAKAPMGWNGRPVFLNHPAEDGSNVSGNTPKLLEKQCFGTLFKSAMDGTSLTSEAWLDEARALVVGADAVRALERMVVEEDTPEVSVGAFVVGHEQEGEFNGQPYFFVWDEVIPDHLAILAEGQIGACSVAMGCGAMRTARVHTINLNGITWKEQPVADIKPPVPAEQRQGVWDSIRSLFGAEVRTAISHTDIINMLVNATRAVEPGFSGFASFDAEKGTYVYEAFGVDGYQLLQRTYKLKGSNPATASVTIGEEATKVRAVTQFAAATAAEPKHNCGCQGQQATEGDAMTREQRIAALISKGKVTEADKTWLQHVPDDKLAILEAQGDQPASGGTGQQAPPANQPAQGGQQAPPASQPGQGGNGQAQDDDEVQEGGNGSAQPRQTAPPQTLQAFVATAPAEYREFIEEGLRTAASRKQSLIKSLKDTGRCKIADAVLQTMSARQLEELVELAGAAAPAQAAPVMDYSGAGLPRHAAAGDDYTADPPPDLVARVKAARGKIQESVN